MPLCLDAMASLSLLLNYLLFMFGCRTENTMQLVMYASDANISDRAEMELHSIRYGSKQIEIGYDLSFVMYNAELVCPERDNDGYFFGAISLELGTMSKLELWIKSEND